MLRYTLIVWLLALLAGLSTPVEADRALQRIESAMPEDIRRQENFDAAESAGLFVGVRSFEDEHFAEVPYAVDDAVDLAHLFAVELSLVAPERVTLALAGEPQKKSSQDRLQALLEAGARQRPAGWADIYELLTESRKATGPRGVLVVTLATHGFNEDGHDYLVGADSRRRFIRRSGIVVAEVLDEIAQATAPRRLVLLDACRERLTRKRASGGQDTQSAMGAAFAEAIAAAEGQVVLSGTTLGGYSYDDSSRGNGVFTGAILDGLRGAAPADERHFITPWTLAGYVNTQVLQWVRDNRPDHVQMSRGISQQIEGSMAHAPLAIDPGGIRGDEQVRQEKALQHLRNNLGGPLTGSLHDLVEQALDRPLPPDLRTELLDELEALDGSVPSKRSLAYWINQHRSRLDPLQGPDPDTEVAVTTPERLPGPSPESVEAALQLERSEVRLIQLGLAAEGFDPGGKDGWIGDQTRAALKQWQASRGEEATGHLEAESARLLKASGEAREAEEEAQRNGAEVAQRQEQERQRAIEAARHKAARRKAAEEAAARRPIGPNWIVARNQPCQVYNPDMVAGETVTWSGSCLDGKASGEGRLVWQGSYGTHVYKDWMRDGKMHGWGTYTWANGNRYEGDWRDDKRTGRGTFTWADGDRYEGDWRDGKKHGRGTYTDDDVGRYKGEFRDDESNGRGIFTWTDGTRYEGDWRGSKMHGRGIYTWANGNRYEGDFRDGKKHGRGTYTWANGTRYEGDFRDGKPHGQGTAHWDNGDRFAGQWRNGCFGKRGGTWAVLATTAEACGFE